MHEAVQSETGATLAQSAPGPCTNQSCGCGPNCRCGEGCVCTPDANCAD